MGAAHADRLAVLFRTRDDGDEGAVDALEHERPRVLHGERQRRVEHVGRGQPVVEEAAFLAQPLGDGVDECGDVVVRLALDLGHACRRRHDRALADRVDRLAGTAPTSAQPSRAASSTSSQRRSFSPSDQMWLMAGRE